MVHVSRINTEDAARLLELFFREPQAAQIARLNGYDDANFKVTVTAPEGESWFGNLPHWRAAPLRREAEWKQITLVTLWLKAQNAAMAHLSSKGIVTNAPLEGLDGCYLQRACFQDEPQQHVVRLFSWVSGKLLGQVLPSLRLCHSLGAFMAGVTTTLSDFSHPGVPKEHSWCMNNAAATIRHRVQACTLLTEQQRDMLLAVAGELDAQQAAWAAALPCQVCHGDANEANLLVTDDREEVIGIIDLGDISECYRAAEVAIAMTYMMLLSWQADPWAAAAAVLGGYWAHCRLQDAELAALPLLIKGRIALSLANGACSVQGNPGNAEYLLVTQKPGFSLLGLLQSRPEELLRICGGFGGS